MQVIIGGEHDRADIVGSDVWRHHYSLHHSCTECMHCNRHQWLAGGGIPMTAPVHALHDRLRQWLAGDRLLLHCTSVKSMVCCSNGIMTTVGNERRI